MLIPIVLLMGIIIGLVYGVYQDIETAIERKQQKQLARINRKKEIEREELRQLDFDERLESMENETTWILKELETETDRAQIIKLNKELQRIQKQRYITKYKE